MDKQLAAVIERSGEFILGKEYQIKLALTCLLARGHLVRAIVRSPDKLPAAARNHDRLSVIQASILDLSDAELAGHFNGCDAVASCLGHNMSWNGVFGKPRQLVTEATRRLCATWYGTMV